MVTSQSQGQTIPTTALPTFPTITASSSLEDHPVEPVSADDKERRTLEPIANQTDTKDDQLMPNTTTVWSLEDITGPLPNPLNTDEHKERMQDLIAEYIANKTDMCAADNLAAPPQMSIPFNDSSSEGGMFGDRISICIPTIAVLVKIQNVLLVLQL